LIYQAFIWFETLASYFRGCECHCEYPHLVEKIDQSLYVNDLVSGDANVQEAFELYKAAKHIMYRGGFNLRKWNSNSSELLKLIDHNDCKLSMSTSTTQKCASKPSTIDRDLCKLLGVIQGMSLHLNLVVLFNWPMN